MKTLKYLSMMAFAAIMSFGLTACNNDDDNGGGGGTRGKTSVTVNGTTFSVSYGYWDAIATNNETVMYQFYAYNNKIENWKDPIHHVSVIYSSNSTIVTGLETGTFDSYTVSVGITTANDLKDIAYYAYAGENGNTGKIKVSKSGDTYTIEVPSLNYHTFENENKTFPGTAFSFTGTLAKMPQDVDAKQFNPQMLGF